MKRKSIRKQITKRIVQVGICTFFISLVISAVAWIPSLQDRAVKMAENGNEEIVRRMENTLTFLENYTENLALSVAQNAGIQSYFSNPTTTSKNIAMLSLNNLTSYEGMVRAVFIEVNGIPLLDSLSRICDEDYAMLSSEWYLRIHEAEFGRRLSPIYEVTLNHVRYYTVAYARNFYQNNQWCTFVVFATLNDTLYDVSVIGDNNFDYYLLRDSEGNIFYSAGDEKWADRTAAVTPDAALSDRIKTDGGTAMVRKGVTSKWSITSFVSDATILHSLAPYSLGLMLALTIFLILILAVLSRSLGAMMQPIIALSHTMDGAAKGNLSQKVPIGSNDEIGLLQQSYNKMLDDLQNSIALIAEKERREQQTKFSLLISQIDPHFICNTINSINYLARKGRCDDVITVNTALMTILRDRLRVNDIEITDSITNEIRVVEQYIVIQRFMYGGDLQFCWQVEEMLREEQIPKNMIQPLVENSLFHGLINEESGEINGEIRISIEKTEQGILLRVSDNGAGMDKARLEQVRRAVKLPEERGNKIGLSNIRARLYYLYGSADGMTIQSALGQGTTITILFPTK